MVYVWTHSYFSVHVCNKNSGSKHTLEMCSHLGRCWSTIKRVLAEVFSTVQLFLSCWENCRKYLSPVSEAEVGNGTPFEFRTSSAWESWERIEVFLETEWRKLLQLFVSDYFEMSDKNREKWELLWIFILNKEHLISGLSWFCLRLLPSKDLLEMEFFGLQYVCSIFSLHFIFFVNFTQKLLQGPCKGKKINSKIVLRMMKELQLKFHPEPFHIWW